MAFSLFPDNATAALLGKPPFAPINLAEQESMRVFVPLPPHRGPDATQAGLSTTFLRIAFAGEDLDPVPVEGVSISAADPASHPGLAQQIDPSSANSLASAVPLFDGINPTSAALAYFEPSDAVNVRLLKIVFEIPDTRVWMRIANKDVDPSFFCVWAVADNDEDSRQPWLTVLVVGILDFPAQLQLDSYVGQGFALNAKQLVIRNFGTAPATLVDCDPPVAAPLALRGLPLSVAAGGVFDGIVSMGLDAPTTAGDFTLPARRFVTRDKTDPGPFGDEHNNSFSITAHVGASNLWTSGKPLALGRSAPGVAASVNGAVCVFGGFDAASNTIVKSVVIFHETGDDWEPAPDMPTGRKSFGAALGRDGLIYTIGGVAAGSNQLTGANEVFNPGTGVWRSLRPMTTPRQGLAVAAGSDGLIYAIGGGTNSEQPFDVVEVYDPVADQWSTRQPLPSPRMYLGAATTADGALYVVGGLTLPLAVLPDLLAFDRNANAWAPKTSMSTGRAGLAFAAGRNGRLYAVGGGALPAGGLKLTEEYDPAANAWRTRANMNAVRAFCGLAAAASGRLFAVGNNFADQRDIEVFTP